ncbi:MAG: hypothetical protein LBR80_05770 [Deltaproteobacteria bacterium]|jgi:nickel transport protein|nr:hypothetical protein [Deltaproteobacteria bacterium]
MTAGRAAAHGASFPTAPPPAYPAEAYRVLGAGICALTLALGTAAACPAPAIAHAVYVFAYADGDEICTESYFTRKNRVTGGRIVMQDASGNEIESASTGDDGNHCFSAPPGEGDLIFVVLAGEGHRGEFSFPAADRPSVAPAPAPAAPSTAPEAPASGAGPEPISASGAGPEPISASGAAPEPSSATGAAPDAPLSGASGSPAAGTTATSSSAAAAAPSSSPSAATAGFSEEALRSIVREELKTQISPVVRALAEAREDRSPGLREIVGGLGWVAGISGLVLWLKRGPGTSGQKD